MLLLTPRDLLYDMTSCFDQGKGERYTNRCSCSFPICNRTSQFSKGYWKDLEILGLSV